MKNSGSADLALMGGYIPNWLFERMVKLSETRHPSFFPPPCARVRIVFMALMRMFTHSTITSKCLRIQKKERNAWRLEENTTKKKLSGKVSFSPRSPHRILDEEVLKQNVFCFSPTSLGSARKMLLLWELHPILSPLYPYSICSWKKKKRRVKKRGIINYAVPAASPVFWNAKSMLFLDLPGIEIHYSQGK